MRTEFSPLRLEPDPLDDPFLLTLKLSQCRRSPHAGDDRVRLVAAERVEACERQVEARPVDALQRSADLLGCPLVDVTDEAEGDVVVFRVDPARSGQSAAEQREREGEGGGDFQGGEETRHASLPYHALTTMRIVGCFGVWRGGIGCA